MSIDQDTRQGSGLSWLDAMPVGPRLAAAVDELSPAELTGEDLGSYVKARWRVHNWATAELFESLHELGRAQDGRTERRAVIDEFSGDEASMLLGWSRTMASRRLDLADELFVRLPEVGAALGEGWIDEPKARAICEWTSDLSDDHAHLVTGLVLPDAAEMPVAELKDRIEALALDLDPDWAERRRKRAESRAGMLLTANPSGTATLSFCDAPAEDGIASQARVDALAATVRRLGVLIPIGPLRVKVGMRLLDGSTAGMDDRTIALLLAAEYHADNAPPDDQEPDDGLGDDDPDDSPDDRGPDDPGPDGSDGRPDDGPDDAGDDPDGEPDDGPDDQPDDEGCWSDDGLDDEPDGEGPDGHGPDGSESQHHGQDDSGHDDLGTGPHDGAARDDHPARGSAVLGSAEQGLLELLGLPETGTAFDPPDGCGPEWLIDPEDDTRRLPGRIRQGLTEVRLRLTTALGLDQHPAAVPGYGTVSAPTARRLLARHHQGEWRIVLTDPDGYLEHVLLARRRPTPGRQRRPRSRDRTRGHRPHGHGRRWRRTRRSVRPAAIVELQVPTTLLAALDPADHPPWTGLLTELRQRLAALGGPDAVATLGPPGPHAGVDAEPHELARRRARVELERWTRVRDRHCVAPACRRSAHRADIDHTRDHALHGPTAHWNLGAWCTHDHRAKHHAGWRVTQPSPGTFVVRTRAGLTHTTHPKKIIQTLPGPRRPASGPRPLPEDVSPDRAHDRNGPVDPDWYRKIAPQRAARTARPAPAPPVPPDLDPDDPPPF